MPRSFQFRDLPSEVAYLILEKASTDDLLAFARVGKYYNATVTRLLYRTVSIPSLDRLLCFYRTLERNPQLAAHVRHLLISDRRKDDFDLFPDINDYSQTEAFKIAGRVRIREWVVARDQDLRNFHIGLCHVLSLVCPTLRSLTLLRYEGSLRLMREILLFDYRALEELTLRGDYPSLPPDIQMPNLRRLHLASGDMPDPWVLFDTLAARCPRLSHLRITEPLSCVLSSLTLAHAFSVAFGIAAPCDAAATAAAAAALTALDGGPMHDITCSWLENLPAPRLPPSLQHVLLQPHPPERNENGEVLTDYSEMLKRLGALEKRSLMLKVVPNDGRTQAFPYEFKHAMEHWLDRLNGGEGCWAGVN